METSNIQAFFSGLKTTLDNTKRFQKANSLEYAFEFNPLIQFYEIGENKLSDMLSFFLKKDEKHGQGDIFLKSFIELIKNDNFNLKNIIGEYKNVTINREKQIIRQRRLDILVDFDGLFGIGIENKKWAKDQFLQLSDYNTWLNKKYNGKYVLIYLTPYGHIPTEESISKEDRKKLEDEKKFFLLDYYKTIISLINLWIEKSQADRVRNFLKDFKQYIDHNFNGSIFMNQQKTISEFILEKPDYLQVAFGVYESMAGIKISLLKKLYEQCEEIAKDLDLSLSADDGFLQNNGGINFMHPELSKDGLRIKIMFSSTKWYCGIVKIDVLKKSSDINKYINEHQEKYKSLSNLKNSNDFWFAYDEVIVASEGYINIISKEKAMMNILRENIVTLLYAFNTLDQNRYHFILPEKTI